MIKRLGYACINTTLAAKKITTGRKMIKATFKERGIAYASKLALLNVTDLKSIIEWNVNQLNILNIGMKALMVFHFHLQNLKVV